MARINGIPDALPSSMVTLLAGPRNQYYTTESIIDQSLQSLRDLTPQQWENLDSGDHPLLPLRMLQYRFLSQTPGPTKELEIINHPFSLGLFTYLTLAKKVDDLNDQNDIGGFGLVYKLRNEDLENSKKYASLIARDLALAIRKDVEESLRTGNKNVNSFHELLKALETLKSSDSLEVDKLAKFNPSISQHASEFKTKRNSHYEALVSTKFNYSADSLLNQLRLQFDDLLEKSSNKEKIRPILEEFINQLGNWGWRPNNISSASKNIENLLKNHFEVDNVKPALTIARKNNIKLARSCDSIFK